MDRKVNKILIFKQTIHMSRLSVLVKWHGRWKCNAENLNRSDTISWVICDRYLTMIKSKWWLSRDDFLCRPLLIANVSSPWIHIRFQWQLHLYARALIKCNWSVIPSKQVFVRLFLNKVLTRFTMFYVRSIKYSERVWKASSVI